MRSIRLRLFQFAVIAAVALTWPIVPSASRAETSAATTRAETRATVDLGELFDAVVETVDRNFVDTERLKTLDWQARARQIRPSVVSAPNVDKAIGIIRDLLGELKLSHNELTTPDDIRYYLTLDSFSDFARTDKFIRERFWGSSPYFPGIGIFSAAIEGTHFIDGVLEGSPADKAGLKFGDEIISVDGQPYSPIVAFRGKVGLDAEIAIRRTRNGEIARYRVPVVPVAPSVAFPDATKASARVIERNGRRVGYIHIWSVKEPLSFRTALASIDPQFAKGAEAPEAGQKVLDALVVDMRGRVGGNGFAASQILDTIGSAPKPYWGNARARTRPDAPRTGFMGSNAAPPPTRPFSRPTVLLVDHHTRSAGEVLSFGYKRSLFGQLFGSRTAGDVTGSIAFPMPGGLLLLVAVDQREYDGTTLEGNGVAPDVQIERPLAYAGGADPVLDAAVAHLSTGYVLNPSIGYGFTR